MDKQKAVELEVELDLLGSEPRTTESHQRACEIAHLLCEHYLGKDSTRDTSICNQDKCKDDCNQCLFNSEN